MKSVTLAIAVMGLACVQAFAQYAPAGNRIMTRWASDVTPENVWREYPRPLMERAEWQNLNGLWQYAIVPAGADAAPERFDGEILVPFCAESSLSGVGRNVGQENELWYNRTFSIPDGWADKSLLLNFGAVDWKCDVWVNGSRVGGHIGGYAPFSLDITDAVKTDGMNTLTVRVFDPTDKGYQARGKQNERPHGIWYTPVTGIWQTVWIEPVDRVHITNLVTVPDIDAGKLGMTINTSTDDGNLSALIEIADSGVTVYRTTVPLTGRPIDIDMGNDVKLWSPDSPFLYDITVTLLKNDEPTDRVESYAAMRKISAAKDASGVMRMQLNNKDLFQLGPLDQGWWPDGLYTAPSYQAMIYDIDMAKELGFNMIRKHVKVEPALWYAYCDRVGMLVWQDMPNGDKSPRWQNHAYFTGTGRKRSQDSETAYRNEWREIMDALRSHPSVVVWVPFNEAWGQFKTPEIARWTKEYDPSRLVNAASGGNFYRGVGDILDLHNYPGPAMYLNDPERVNVLGEYGGIGYAVEGHLWEPDRNWGYVKFKTSSEATDCYVKYAEELLEMVQQGFSAAVYTQITDVEIEVNGILTYDRAVTKLDADRVRRINRRIVNSIER